MSFLQGFPGWGQREGRKGTGGLASESRCAQDPANHLWKAPGPRSVFSLPVRSPWTGALMLSRRFLGGQRAPLILSARMPGQSSFPGLQLPQGQGSQAQRDGAGRTCPLVGASGPPLGQRPGSPLVLQRPCGSSQAGQSHRAVCPLPQVTGCPRTAGVGNQMPAQRPSS